MLKTAHWLWARPLALHRGPQEGGHERQGHQHHQQLLHRPCPATSRAAPRATRATAGRTRASTSPTRTTSTASSCHDTTGTYKKVPPRARGMPDPKVDLVNVAQPRGQARPRQLRGPATCPAGGGDAVKHADMSSQLLFPRRSCDVHMGGYDFQCQYCHKTIDPQDLGPQFLGARGRGQPYMRGLPHLQAALRPGAPRPIT